MSSPSFKDRGCKPWLVLCHHQDAGLTVDEEFFTEKEAQDYAVKSAEKHQDGYYFVVNVRKMVVQPKLLPGSVVVMEADMIETVSRACFGSPPEQEK